MGKTSIAQTANKAIVRALLRSVGVTVARLDYHKPDGCIYLTASVAGQIKHIPLPSSQPVTADEICEILFGGMGAQVSEPAAAAECCTVGASDPPPP
jgi:hypothetical protein